MKMKMLFYINFILIFILIPIKIIDFSMSLEYIGTNNICESNPFGYLFLGNPIMIFMVFIMLTLFYITFNEIIYKKYKELIYLLSFILISLNLLGIYILFNNFQILSKVLG